MTHMARREFLGRSVVAAAGAVMGRLGREAPARENARTGDAEAAKFRLGLVTYMWGADWDLPTLIANCETAGYGGVELRVDHKHAVSPALTQDQRKEVVKRLAGSKVTLVGLGTNFQFHEKDPAAVRKNIEGARQYIQLCRDLEAGGVKVKPNDLPRDVPVEKTIEQIGGSLNELAEFAAPLKVQVRLEVHGGAGKLEVIKAIMDVAKHPNAAVCWNSNMSDLSGKGLEHNFNLVKDRLGGTVHVRELDDKRYPFKELLGLLKKARYSGWVLLEAGGKPKDRVQAMIEQRKLFESMI